MLFRSVLTTELSIFVDESGDREGKARYCLPTIYAQLNLQQSSTKQKKTVGRITSPSEALVYLKRIGSNKFAAKTSVASNQKLIILHFGSMRLSSSLQLLCARKRTDAIALSFHKVNHEQFQYSGNEWRSRLFWGKPTEE